jgi:hypothetical protein
MKEIKYRSALLAIALASILICPAEVNAGGRVPGVWPFKKKAATEQKDTTRKKSEYDKLFEKEKKCARGFITIHLVEGKVYFEIPDSLMGKGMLLGSTIKSTSDNGNGLVGSKLEPIHFAFTKSDDYIQMRTIDSDYMSNDSNIQEAISKSHLGAIFQNFKIETKNADSTAYVVDVTDLFLSDVKEMRPFVDNSLYSKYKRTEEFEKDKSFITDVKAFADNISVSSDLTYKYSLSTFSGVTVTKDQPFTALMTRSIVMLLDQVYHPRIADPRIGFFFTQREQLGNMSSSSKDVFFTNRWRLEPSDTAAFRRGEKVTPVKPIVFYIDRNFPQWWKPYIRKAVEAWNEPFEAIGFKNAVVAEDFPDNDPQFDPDNLKYSCIRYAPVGIMNSMGPSWVDPRSGEIINASVFIYHDVIKLLTTWLAVQTSQLDTAVRVKDIPQEILGNGLEYVVRHELGHCLGLMHNMSGSSVVPVDSLRSPSYTAKYGTTTSIMDYARFNYVAQPSDKGVSLTPPAFGPYDRWAIRWGYTPIFDVHSFAQEEQITKGWITDSLKAAPFYRYGKQQMSSTFYDPRCQTEDLGDDVVKASEYGVSNLKYIMSHFMDWYQKGDEDYDFRVTILNGILNQYLTYVQHVFLNVGGLYKNEVVAGDGVPRYANVPSAKQKECLDYLKRLYEDVGWMNDKKVLGNLPVVGDPSYAVQSAVLDLIFMTPYLEGFSDGVSTEEFSPKECMDFIYDFIWKPTRQGTALTTAQRTAQKSFVMTFMNMAGFKVPKAEDKLSSGELISYTGFEQDDQQWRPGYLTYDPVSGFEWTPRAVFNPNQLNQAIIYAYLTKARDLMKAHRAGASDQDKAHYDILIDTIQYSLK